MTPWDVLGWLLVALIFFTFFFKPLLAIVLATIEWLREYYKYFITRNVKPEKGQIWSSFSIKGMHVWGMSCSLDSLGRMTIPVMNEDWKRFIRRKKAYYIRTIEEK